MNPLLVRKAGSAEDWRAIREICCKTARSGQPIERERWPFFGELWIGPYQTILSDWTLVAVTPDRVLGYLTGCPDTASFERAKSWRFTPKLAAKVILGHFKRTSDTRRFLRRVLLRERPAESFFRRETRARLAREFPAHLHINVESEARGQGVGAMLMSDYLSQLARAGVRGAHVFCGPRPVEFYRRSGFELIERIEFSPNVPVFALARKLEDSAF